MKRASKPAADTEYEQVLDLVAKNPRAWLGVAELATLFRLPVVYITAANGAKDTPFIGKSCHPDVLDQWLRNHPGLTP